jgi:hypothetical protein
VVRAVVLLTLAGLAVAVVMRVVDLLDKPPAEERAAVRADEFSVAEAFSKHPTRAVVVRGYVFAGDGFPVRVCNGIKRSSPAGCVGPYLVLSGLDPSRVPVVSMRSGGRTVIWSPEPVGLLGQVDADRFAVRELLN